LSASARRAVQHPVRLPLEQLLHRLQDDDHRRKGGRKQRRPAGRGDNRNRRSDDQLDNFQPDEGSLAALLLRLYHES
jgi:hypothetical protein